MAEYIDKDSAVNLISRMEEENDGLVSNEYYKGYCAAIRQAADAIDAMPAESSSRGWISVRDKLPEVTKRCLVVRYDDVSKALFIDILWFEQGQWWNRRFVGDYKVTHWQPLPELPKEENYEN